jgi:hypothetical protein
MKNFVDFRRKCCGDATENDKYKGEKSSKCNEKSSESAWSKAKKDKVVR